MKPTFNWTDAADATLIRMRADRVAFSVVADVLGCTTRHAWDRSTKLRKSGISVWTGNSNRQRSPELIAKIRDMIRRGMSQRAVAAEIGICQYNVRKWLDPKRPTVPRTPPASAPLQAEPEVARVTRRRDAKPPGDPVSWGAITAGTLLDGVGYPPT